jgi:hypothetical protein
MKDLSINNQFPLWIPSNGSFGSDEPVLTLVNDNVETGAEPSGDFHFIEVNMVS